MEHGIDGQSAACQLMCTDALTAMSNMSWPSDLTWYVASLEPMLPLIRNGHRLAMIMVVVYPMFYLVFIF